MPSELRASIMSNCELMACFRVSRNDADVMAKELYGGVYDEAQAWEPRIQRLQKFKEREFIFKNRKKGGVVILEAFDTPPIWQVYHWTKEDYMENGGGSFEANIGKNHLRKREDIRAEYLARRKALGVSDEPEGFRRKRGTESISYEEIIKGGENNRVEFKESLRLANAAAGKDKIMEHAVAKAISAFMNSEGGTLFIGVRDDGAIIGNRAGLRGTQRE